MEHLPSLEQPYEPIQIPYLGGPIFDGGDFAGYPARQNWNTQLLLQGQLQGRTASEASQFLQTWLYFGMLNEALKLEESDIVDLSGFTRTDSVTGEQLITTAPLNVLMSEWYQRIQAYPDVPDPPNSKKSILSKTKLAPIYYQRFRTNMKAACGIWRDLLQPPSPELASLNLLSQEILLSINILGAALDIGVTEVCGSSADYDWRINPRNEWLMDRMVKQGWCPCTVEQMSRPCMTFLYFASLMGPPRREDTHESCESKEGAVCKKGNVKTENYVPKHVEEECQCQSITVTTGEGSLVAEAIDSEKIPILKVIVDGEGEEEKVTVEISSYSETNNIRYTAISHV
jgi:hypothetical protein